jgi:hypothetical protein
MQFNLDFDSSYFNFHAYREEWIKNINFDSCTPQFFISSGFYSQSLFVVCRLPRLQFINRFIQRTHGFYKCIKNRSLVIVTLWRCIKSSQLENPVWKWLTMKELMKMKKRKRCDEMRKWWKFNYMNWPTLAKVLLQCDERVIEFLNYHLFSLYRFAIVTRWPRRNEKSCDYFHNKESETHSAVAPWSN